VPNDVRGAAPMEKDHLTLKRALASATGTRRQERMGSMKAKQVELALFYDAKLEVSKA
jgi:hypothetical protein